MSALLPAHRRAERFAALVDDRSATGADGRYAELLEVVGTLRSAADHAPVPRADYVADLRSRLMAEAATALVPTDSRLVLPQRTTPRRRHGRVTAAAVGLVLAGSSAGIAMASQASLPGDGLYPVKRGIEQVHEAVSFSDAGRGRDLLGQADSRLDEVDGLLDRGADDRQVAATLHSFTVTAGQGADLLFRSYQRNGDDASITSVREFAGTQMGRLTDLSDGAPASLRPDFAQAAQLVADLDQQAIVLCADCGPRSPLQLPSDLQLASAERALTHLLDLDTPAGTPGPVAADATGSTATPVHRPGSSTGPKDTPPATTPTVALPSLEQLLGAPGSTSATGGDGTTTAAGPGPLDPVLRNPTSVTTSIPGVGEVTKKVTGEVDQKITQKVTQKLPTKLQQQLGALTDPLLQPKP